ncbi:MAG: ATP-binding protein [Chitinophagaceae bacterium]
MKSLPLYIILLLVLTSGLAQSPEKDSLLRLLSEAKQDTTKVNLLDNLSGMYRRSNPDSMFMFANEGLKLAQSIGYKKGEISCKWALAAYWWERGDFATALNLNFQVLEYFKAQKDTVKETIAYSTILNCYRDEGDYTEALYYGKILLDRTEKYVPVALGISNTVVGSVYYGMKKYDSAMYYLTKGVNYPPNINYPWILLMNGRVNARLKNNTTAFGFYRQSIVGLRNVHNLKDLAGAYTSIAELFKETGNTDSAIYYGKLALNVTQEKKLNKELWEASILLANIYEKKNSKEALEFYRLAMITRDSLFNQEKQRQMLSYKFNEELKQQELKSAEQQIKNRNRIYWLIAILVFFLSAVIFLIRNNKRKQKINALLQKQKQEIQDALMNLKSTQSQLIQSEKMASLGELTAGIAHEIQNPLNFVNNFSDVNAELIAEMKEEINKGNLNEIKMIAKDIEENEQKISHHGKRADAIVKGMLQHSRNNAGQKEPTNINALADEYFRLSYHGLRAKDNNFNASMQTNFDESIGNINIIPQDIGRVLLNLFTNAFYAVAEKKKQHPEGYEPAVSVSTKKINDKVEVHVIDNGNGIPQKVLDKIFQPFFTTKPTGQGTGLGLSLSYDIIKAYGGEIKVETKEGEGAAFVILLSAIYI